MTAQIGIVRQTRLLRQSGPIFSSLPPPTFDPATLAWVAAVIAAGGTVTNAREILVDNLIKGLKTDGVWTRLDRLWIHAMDNQTEALVDMVADSSATAVNSPTFTANSGFTGQASATPTTYIDSGYKETGAGNNFVQNSSHVSTWLRNSSISVPSGTGYAVGCNSATDESVINFNSAGPTVNGCATDGTGPFNSPVLSDKHGHWLVTRTASTSSTLYQNGTSSATASTASAALNTNNMFILAFNNSGAAGNGFNDVVCATSMGGALTATDATNFYNRLRTYMTAVGVP